MKERQKSNSFTEEQTTTSDAHLNLHTQSAAAAHHQHQNKERTVQSHFQMMQDASQRRGACLLWLLYTCAVSSYKVSGLISEWFINRQLADCGK